jgi:hypothetical protein
MDKIQGIKKSVSCFRWGLSSFLLAVLVPGLSVIFAAIAIGRGLQAKAAFGGEWNPAARHLWWGFQVGLLGRISVADTDSNRVFLPDRHFLVGCDVLFDGLALRHVQDNSAATTERGPPDAG